MTKGVHVEIFGQGKAVVLLHGWAMHAGVLNPFAQRLAEHARVVCVDLPGHGQSAAIQSFTLQSIVAALLEALDDEPCYWLGWSLGGLVALEVVRQAPKKVLGLILLAGNPCFVAQEAWVGIDAAVLEAFTQHLHHDVGVTVYRFSALQVYGLANAKPLLRELRTLLDRCEQPSLATLQAGLMILKQQDLRADFAALKCPVLVILGGRDALVPIAIVPYMKALNANAQLVLLEEAGHVPFLSHPEETVVAVMRLINST